MARVVIGRVGVVAGPGIGASALLGALRAGPRAFGESPLLASAGLRLVAAEAPLPPASPPTPRAFHLLSLAAAEATAGLDLSSTEAPTALCLGTAQGALDAPEGPLRLPGAAAHALAARLRLTRPVTTLSMACVSSAEALRHGLDLLRRGDAARVLVGGFEALHPLMARGFDGLGATSQRGCRPFDLDRDGMSLGEGAAVLLLEWEVDVLARGEHPRAVVRGAAGLAEAYRLAAPEPSGARLAETLSAALDDAGLPASAVDWIKAHGTGTRRGDDAELAGLARLGASAPISSLKPHFGHTLGAAGAVEAAAAILALEAGWCLPTPGLVRPARPDLPLLMGPPRPWPELRRALLCFSGFGGQHAACVLERWCPADAAPPTGPRPPRTRRDVLLVRGAALRPPEEVHPATPLPLSPRDQAHLSDASRLACCVAVALAPPSPVDLQLGSTHGCLAANDAYERGPDARAFEETVANAPLAWVARCLGGVGQSQTGVSGALAGLEAVVAAAEGIRRGRGPSLALAVERIGAGPRLAEGEGAVALLLGAASTEGPPLARLVGWARGGDLAPLLRDLLATHGRDPTLLHAPPSVHPSSLAATLSLLDAARALSLLRAPGRLAAVAATDGREVLLVLIEGC